MLEYSSCGVGDAQRRSPSSSRQEPAITGGSASTSRAVRRNLARGAHRVLDAVRAQVEQLAVDLRRDRRDIVREARRCEQLAVNEARVRDREEKAADAAGLHHLNVHPLGEHGHLPAAHELLVARLREHRLADREQHDHDADAERVAEEQEERAERTVGEIPQRDERDHTRGSRQGGGLSGARHREAEGCVVLADDALRELRLARIVHAPRGIREQLGGLLARERAHVHVGPRSVVERQIGGALRDPLRRAAGRRESGR